MSAEVNMEKDKVFLEIAQQLGQLSTCDRASIGAVVTREGRCVCWGYNGAPPGLPHCDENLHGWRGWLESKEGPDRRSIEERADVAIRANGCRNSTHAEANALAFAARSGISTEGGTLYVSQSPCLDCARLLIAAGITRVVYNEQYRDSSGIELLRTANVSCDRLE